MTHISLHKAEKLQLKTCLTFFYLHSFENTADHRAPGFMNQKLQGSQPHMSQNGVQEPELVSRDTLAFLLLFSFTKS